MSVVKAHPAQAHRVLLGLRKVDVSVDPGILVGSGFEKARIKIRISL